jgi:hypothetical protein
MYLYSSLRVICAITIHARLIKKPYNTLFKITLHILMILCVEMRFQMIQNSNRLMKEVSFLIQLYLHV